MFGLFAWNLCVRVVGFDLFNLFAGGLVSSFVCTFEVSVWVLVLRFGLLLAWLMLVLGYLVWLGGWCMLVFGDLFALGCLNCGSVLCWVVL